MNYSASESYSRKCNQFRQKVIDPKKIRRRWFRNFYVLYQSKGWFTHNTFVYEAGSFNPDIYPGTFYGPFLKKDAEAFAEDVRTTHWNFITG